MITKLLLSFSGIAADPCDCSGHGNFLQRDSEAVRPWKTFLPISKGSDNPCGCDFQKTTSRDDLQKMPMANLRQLLAKLEEENEQLKTDVETQEEEHKKELAAKKKLVAELFKKQQEFENKTEDSDEARGSKIHEHAQDVKAKEEEMEKLNKELSQLRGEWYNINQEVSVQLAQMADCPACSGKKLSLVKKHSNFEEPMDLILQIERLEMKKNSLLKEQGDGLKRFNSEVRRYDHEKELADQKMSKYISQADKYRRLDEKRQKLIKEQLDILAPVLKDREAAVTRTKKSLEDARNHLKDLSEQIAKCCKH